MRVVSILVLLILAFAHAQEDSPPVVRERGVPTQVAPGVTIIVDPDLGGEFFVAEEIYVFPRVVGMAIPYEKEYGAFTLEFSSRVQTEIVLEVSDSENLVIGGSPRVVLPAGSRINVGFTAYAPHSGTISVFNTEGALLDVVSYSVVKADRFEHAITGRASSGVETDFNNVEFGGFSLSAAYQIREIETGIIGGVGLSYNGENLSLEGQISGTYRW